MSTEWTTPQMKATLAQQLVEAKELMNSRVIKTEEGRAIVVQQVRLLETLVTGDPPTTALPARHHE